MAHLLTLISATPKPACWICALSIPIAIIPPHLLCQMSTNPPGVELFQGTISKFRKIKKKTCVYDARTKLFCVFNLLFLFDVVVAVASLDAGTGLPYERGGPGFPTQILNYTPKEDQSRCNPTLFQPLKENILNFDYMNRVNRTDWKAPCGCACSMEKQPVARSGFSTFVV